MDVMLVCARATERLTLRGSTFDQYCSKCGQRVMIAPSGQRVLREMKPIIICLQCSDEIKEPRINCWAVESPEELARERATVIPNLHRRRN